MPIALKPRQLFASGAVFLMGAALFCATLSGRIALSWSEVLGFITGALGVYLTVKSSAWNFPAGLANHRCPDLYLLTDVNIPFVQDGLRDGETIRHEMHRKFVAELENSACFGI